MNRQFCDRGEKNRKNEQHFTKLLFFYKYNNIRAYLSYLMFKKEQSETKAKLKLNLGARNHLSSDLYILYYNFILIFTICVNFCQVTIQLRDAYSRSSVSINERFYYTNNCILHNNIVDFQWLLLCSLEFDGELITSSLIPTSSSFTTFPSYFCRHQLQLLSFIQKLTNIFLFFTLRGKKTQV